MTASIEITIDAVDPEPLARFWAAAVGYARLYERDPYLVLGPPPADARPRVLVQRVDAVATGKPPVHMDLRVDDPGAEVERLRGLGATVAWVVDGGADGAADGAGWTTMADPWGTLFCACPARKE